jgi:hypothetical protein
MALMEEGRVERLGRGEGRGEGRGGRGEKCAPSFEASVGGRI